MKTLKILTLALFATSIAVAQDLNLKEVPNNLKDALSKEYSNATDLEWEKELDHYKVEFDIKRRDHEIWYDVSGKILKKEIEISKTELPKVILDLIKSKYVGYRVDDVEMIWQNNATTFDVELEKGREEKNVLFDDKAKILNERSH